LVSARQVRQPIASHHDIKNAFDSITYDKGAGLLEMFERWLGADTFRQGIRLYIERHRWGNATAEDLLSALAEVSGRDVAAAFGTFLFQPGVPLVEGHVETEGSASHGGPWSLTLRQSRYLPVGSSGERD